MKKLAWMSALLVAGMLTACNGEEAPEGPDTASAVPETVADGADWEASIAVLRGLSEDAFNLDGAAEADLTAISEALPDLFSISWDAKAFDEASGATVLQGLKITIATDPEFGLQAEEAEIWGLNSDLIAARLRGERLAETGLAFNRLEARNVSYFGAAGAMNTLFDAFEDTIREDTGEDYTIDVETFEASTAEMVLSNVSLRPFELEPVSDAFFERLGLADEDLSQKEIEQKEMGLSALRLLQHVLAVSRSFSVEQGASYDTTASVAMNQTGMNQTVEVSWDFYGYEGLSGLDLDRAVLVDTRQVQSTEMTDETGEFAEIGLEDFSYDQVETTAFMSYEGVKLDKLASFLVRSEFPMMDEKDLLSLGTWEARDYTLTLNEGDLFEADRVFLDAQDFAWLIPEDLTLEMTGAEIEAEALGEFIVAIMPMDEADEEAVDFKDKLEEAVSKLEEHGLKTIPFDTSFNASWDETSGETGFSFSMTSEGFGDGLATLDITMPDYGALQAASQAEEIEPALEDALEAAFAFRGARFYEEDLGGYDKLFGYMIAIGKLYPNEGWGATLSGMDVQQMRSFIATMIRSGKGMAAQELPQAADWLESMALYYQTSGGSLDIRVEPPEAITMPYFEGLGSQSDPEEIVEDFGISVTHTPE